jgi:hypothetical protein
MKLPSQQQIPAVSFVSTSLSNKSLEPPCHESNHTLPLLELSDIGPRKHTEFIGEHKNNAPVPKAWVGEGCYLLYGTRANVRPQSSWFYHTGVLTRICNPPDHFAYKNRLEVFCTKHGSRSPKVRENATYRLCSQSTC